jgi:hypothetical protein
LLCSSGWPESHSLCSLGWPGTHDPPALVSQAGITWMGHNTQLVIVFSDYNPQEDRPQPYLLSSVAPKSTHSKFSYSHKWVNRLTGQEVWFRQLSTCLASAKP